MKTPTLPELQRDFAAIRSKLQPARDGPSSPRQQHQLHEQMDRLASHIAHVKNSHLTPKRPFYA
jgi:hypothetical protein